MPKLVVMSGFALNTIMSERRQTIRAPQGVRLDLDASYYVRDARSRSATMDKRASILRV